MTAVSPQLTSFAVVYADEEQNEEFFAMLFGVDADSYRTMFPEAAEIVAGQPLAPGEPGILVQTTLAEEIEEQLGKPVLPGDPLTLTAIGGNGLRIREVTVRGIFRFQQEMQGLNRVAIIDAQSLRSLAGLVVSTGQIELSARRPRSWPPTTWTPCSRMTSRWSGRRKAPTPPPPPPSSVKPRCCPSSAIGSARRRWWTPAPGTSCCSSWTPRR